MTPEMHERIRGRALAPEGSPAFLFGGELHYFRIPRALWRDRLRKARAAFLNMAGVYIPWNYHEPEEGRFAFEDDRNLREWLNLVRESGMYLFARPGPYICAEWDGGGLPAWFYGKDRLARTGDPEYLEAVSRWFRAVNGILRDFLPEKGGNLILCQIENELIWDEPQYFRQMVAWARRDGITCPLLTNLAPDVRKSPDIIDSLDLYPGPWNVHKPEAAIASLLEEQPAKPAACVELQMGFAAEVGSTLPTMVGPIEKGWVEVHTKTAIARGLNILNYFMFAGGTSFGYTTGRRDITSYDYDAAVREWGELGPKYYMARRLGAFLEFFGGELAQTLPAEDVTVEAPRGVTVLQRYGKDSAFIFPRNLTRSEQRITFRLPLPDGDEIPFPARVPLYLGPQSMKMLPVDVWLGEGVSLVYSTSEIFGVYRNEGETALVVYGDPGERGEILLRGVAGFDHVRGEAAVSEERGGLLVSFIHRAGTSHVLLLARDADEFISALRGVRIILADRDTVEHTWIMDTATGRMPVLSDVYFLDSASDAGAPDSDPQSDNSPDTWIQQDSAPQHIFPVSRRPGGEGFVEFPCAANSIVPPTASIEGEDLSVTVDRLLRTVRIALPPVEAPVMDIPLTPWTMREEYPLELGDQPGWKPFRAFLGNERSGECEGGYYSYLCRFTHEGPTENVRLLLTEIHDNVDIWLNGHYLEGGSAKDNNGIRMEVDASQALRRGGNELFLLIENEARPRKGDDATFTGLTGPVALDSGGACMMLREWRRGYLSAETESALGTIPAEALPGFDDASWEQVGVRPGWDSRLVIPPTSTHIELGHERVYAVYRTTVTLPEGLNGGGVILDVSKCDGKCWIYLNGKRVDKKHQERFAVDLTPFAREGENTLALVIRNFRWYTTVGLHGNVTVRLADRVLADGWEFIRGLPGQRERWLEKEMGNLSPLEGIAAPSRCWIAAEFDYLPTPGWTAPIGLRLTGWNAGILIYINGFLAGRYHPEGPQEMFYLPEDRLRDRNRLVLFCNAHNAPVRVGIAEIQPYYAVKEGVLEVKL